MATKKKATLRSAPAGGIGVVHEGGAHGALRRGPAKDLSAEEEKVMRMRLGASPPRTAPLERTFVAGTDAEIEVRAAEIEAWLRWKARAGARTGGAGPVPQPSRAKERIIRALRRKT